MSEKILDQIIELVLAKCRMVLSALQDVAQVPIASFDVRLECLTQGGLFDVVTLLSGGLE